MSDDPTPRDISVVWRTLSIVALVVVSCIGAVVAAVVWEVRQDERLKAVEKWQENRDRDAARELWRRNREQPTTTDRAK